MTLTNSWRLCCNRVQSQLTVASDKARGILGKADLDLSQFSYDDFKVLKLDVRDCQYEGAWIEVGLKAVPANRASSRTNNLNESYRSNATTIEQVDQSNMTS